MNATALQGNARLVLALRTVPCLDTCEGYSTRDHEARQFSDDFPGPFAAVLLVCAVVRVCHEVQEYRDQRRMDQTHPDGDIDHEARQFSALLEQRHGCGERQGCGERREASSGCKAWRSVDLNRVHD